MNRQQGLTSEEARSRLQQYGHNELVRTAKVHPLRILLSQFSSPLILVLIAAALVSLAVGFLPGQDSNIMDAVLILIIVLLSGLFGFFQDYEAEKTIEALQEMAAPHAKVIRDGQEREISSTEVVPGDLLVFESGDMITADCDLLESFHLEVNESVLTGESESVRKKSEGKVYAHTYVTGGNGRGIVQQIGMDTRVGEVASRLQEMGEEKTPFQQELVGLSKKMSLLTLVIAVVIALVGIFRFGYYNALLTAISLAVAAIPEGLPAVVVLALAVGANLMVKKNALARKLSIVESVGAVDVICTDKTGTITENEMTVVKLYFDGAEREVGKNDMSLGPVGEMLLRCGMLCNNASKGKNDAGETVYLGEQTEISLKKISEQKLDKSQYRNYRKVNEVSFNSERKMMSVVMEDPDKNYTVFSKGAPEVLLEHCDRILRAGGTSKLEAADKKAILGENEQLTGQALRVLGFAYKPTDQAADGIEKNLVWIGLQAMMDPPRPEVQGAIAECKSAGIRIMMITGDNPKTAEAIARQVGLQSQGVIEGRELEDMEDAVLKERLEAGVNIFARTTPLHKLRLLEVLEKDHNVAMTGDGVNDALAIKKASVGIAMGLRGTEVAKQASDIVLLDDNFSTIRDAVKSGRTIFNNIRKFINYLLTCNVAEVAVIFLATLFFSLHEPILLPVQLLWINLLTDGLVALALGVDPPAGDIMLKPPRKRNEPVINSQLGWLIGLIGLVKTIMLLLTYMAVNLYDHELARSVLFTAFILYEFVRIAVIRYQEKLTWLSNKWLLLSLVGSLVLQLLILYTPANSFFNVVALGWREWGVVLLGSAVGFALALPLTHVVVKWKPE